MIGRCTPNLNRQAKFLWFLLNEDALYDRWCLRWDKQYTKAGRLSEWKWQIAGVISPLVINGGLRGLSPRSTRQVVLGSNQRLYLMPSIETTPPSPQSRHLPKYRILKLLIAFLLRFFFLLFFWSSVCHSQS